MFAMAMECVVNGEMLRIWTRWREGCELIVLMKSSPTKRSSNLRCRERRDGKIVDVLCARIVRCSRFCGPSRC